MYFSLAVIEGICIQMDRCVAFMVLAIGIACVLVPLGTIAQSVAGPDVKPIEVKVSTRKEPVSYSREIAEIIEDKCTGCHGSVLAEKGLYLESVAGMMKGGKRGPSIVRGKADLSLLFKLAAHP